jgi:hypothetical protein
VTDRPADIPPNPDPFLEFCEQLCWRSHGNISTCSMTEARTRPPRRGSPREGKCHAENCSTLNGLMMVVDAILSENHRPSDMYARLAVARNAMEMMVEKVRSGE